MTMNTYIPYISVNITALCCFSLMLVTFLAAKKTPEIKSFLIVLADCILWSGASILMRFQMWPGVNFWYTVSLVALFCMELVFYYFVHTVSHQKGKFLLILFTVWTLLNLPATIMGLYLPAPIPATRADGALIFLYNKVTWRLVIPCIMFVAIIGATAWTLLRILRTQGTRSPGVQVILIGGGVMLLGNLLQVCLPGNTFPYDALSGIIFAFLLMYALYKRRMFQMTLIFSRTVLTLILAAICLFFASNLLLPIENFVSTSLGLNTEAAITVVALAFSALLGGSYWITRRLLDSLFTREEQRNRLIKKFSEEINQSLHTADIMRGMSEIISGEIATEKAYICPLEGGVYQARYCSSPLAARTFSISKDSPLIACLNEQGNYLIMEEFRNSPQYLSVWESEKDLFRRLNIDCVAAMRDGEDIVGLVLLSAKDHYCHFNAAETGFIETVCSIASIAMKNAVLYEKMYREARIDPLTGAYNYRYFTEQLDEQFHAHGRECLTLLYLDVDDFKLYNQLYGAGEGDDALRRISETISCCVGEQGTVFRTSGKVFAVLLPLQDSQRARTLAHEIGRQVSRINQAPERARLKELTVSAGICSAPYAAASAKELMDNADLAVYNAKQIGKAQVLVFRGASNLMPQQLAERTEAIIDRVEEGDSAHKNAIAMISALTAAIDAKDHYTYAHSKNVARYAATLAVASGLNDDQVRTIYISGLLHDIGKISIPEAILNKESRLSEEEYQAMKDHVNNSIAIIRHLPEMDYLIPAVLGHHERWDGKGYPRGIAGKEIPVTARCLAIADVFDAMTTDRPYRKGMSLEYALGEITRGAGTQFDPELAVAFVQLIQTKRIPLQKELAV